MKILLCSLAFVLLCIPPSILGCITYIFTAIWEFKFNSKQFLKGSQWLDKKFNYGKPIEKLLSIIEKSFEKDNKF